MLGNVLDNAWKWAASHVDISSKSDADSFAVLFDDDGPGLPPERRESVLARGVRADERVPGSSLGLAIVSDLAKLHGGLITLDASPLGGLRLLLTLPAARKCQSVRSGSPGGTDVQLYMRRFARIDLLVMDETPIKNSCPSSPAEWRDCLETQPSKNSG